MILARNSMQVNDISVRRLDSTVTVRVLAPGLWLHESPDPPTVTRVAARYSPAAVVVPGHGAISGFKALQVTQTLISEKGPAAVDALRRRQGKSS